MLWQKLPMLELSVGVSYPSLVAAGLTWPEL
jgi:hypothetical protein